jgi:hypothetical protein
MALVDLKKSKWYLIDSKISEIFLLKRAAVFCTSAEFREIVCYILGY